MSTALELELATRRLCTNCNARPPKDGQSTCWPCLNRARPTISLSAAFYARLTTAAAELGTSRSALVEAACAGDLKLPPSKPAVVPLALVRVPTSPGCLALPVALASLLDDFMARHRNADPAAVIDRAINAAIDDAERGRGLTCAICTAALSTHDVGAVCRRCDDEHPNRGGYSFDGGSPEARHKERVK